MTKSITVIVLVLSSFVGLAQDTSHIIVNNHAVGETLFFEDCVGLSLLRAEPPVTGVVGYSTEKTRPLFFTDQMCGRVSVFPLVQEYNPAIDKMPDADWAVTVGADIYSADINLRCRLSFSWHSQITTGLDWDVLRTISCVSPLSESRGAR